MKIRDRIKSLRRVRAGDLVPNPRNWRTHPQEQQDALRGILAEVGYADALIARQTPDGLMLIDGHLRAEIDADAKVPVLVLDVTEEEADKIMLTLDPLAAMAEADKQQLGELLHDVQVQSDAVQAMLDGLAEENGVDLLGDASDTPDTEPQTDRAEELRELWATEEGQLWAIPGKAGEHRLLCGDCREAGSWERLLGGKRINVCMTSPPYASQRKYDESSGFKPIKPDEYVDWWEAVQAGVKMHIADDGSFFVNIKPACEGLERELYVFDLVVAMRRRWGWLFAEEFCWERTGIPQQVVRRFKNQFEPIYQFTAGDWKIRPKQVRNASGNVPIPRGKGAGDTNAARRQGRISAVEGNDVAPGMAYPGNRLPVFCESHEALGHSAAFPVGLPSFFYRAFSDPGDVVADPFAGSGTCLIAAEQLSRLCYGIEISPAYCAVILQRMTDAGLEPYRKD